MSLADRLKQEVSLRALCESDGIAWDRRKSSDARGDWWACCPFHGEATPSFHVVEKAGMGGFFKCFGCGAKGTAIDYAMARDGVDTAEAMRRLAAFAGLAVDGDRVEDKAAARARAEKYEARRLAQVRGELAAAERGKALAARWWKEARPAEAAPRLAAYLRARGVDLGALAARFGWPDGVPPSLRLHPSLGARYPGAREPAHTGPAMLGRIGRKGDFRGVHRTWITPEGRATWPREPGVKIPKQWLGETGRMKGQPVVLAPAAATVVVGEGIETTLALFSALVATTEEPMGAEAALSLGAMVGDGPVGLRAGHLPAPGTRRVMLALEGRPKDRGRALDEWGTIRARYEAAGLEVEAVEPPGGPSDARDWADLAAGA